MPTDKRLMGLFKDPDQVIEALKAFKASTWSVVRVHGPIPNHKIAHALDHAHEAGVIHRDLKPSNIMLDTSGKPYLMDFGLAKREAAEITVTLDGKLLGTPAYMSPEQARGQARESVPRRSIRFIAAA